MELTLNVRNLDCRSKTLAFNIALGETSTMKLSHLLLNTFAIGIFALVSTAGAQAQEPNHALVTALAGLVEYSHNGGAFVPLPVGKSLGKGDVIRTGPASHCDLAITKNVGNIQITPKSTFGITDLLVTKTAAETVTDSQFDLSRGAIFARVNKLAKASRYEIKTPRGIAGVRGTTLYLTANGDLTVEEGMAGIAYTGGGVFVLHDKQTISPGDAAPREASLIILRDIVEALFDVVHHGIGRDIIPFVPPNETYTSPVFPNLDNDAAPAAGAESK